MIKERFLTITVCLVVSLVQACILHAKDYDHFMNAIMLSEERKYSEAAVEYEKAIDQNPSMMDSYNSLGIIYQYQLNDYQKAKDVYLRGIKQAPKDYDLNLNLMYVYFKLGNIDDGIKQYELLSTLRTKEKRFAFPRKILDAIYKDMDDEKELEFATNYLTMNPTDTILREKLVAFYKGKKDYINMKHHLEEMMEYGDNSASVFFDLGTCNYQLGYPDKALTFFQKAKDLGANVPQEFFEKLHNEVGAKRTKK